MITFINATMIYLQLRVSSIIFFFNYSRYDKYEFEPTVRNGTTKSQPNGTFPSSPDTDVPPSYEEAEPFLTMQTTGKETIV